MVENNVAVKVRCLYSVECREEKFSETGGFRFLEFSETGNLLGKQSEGCSLQIFLRRGIGIRRGPWRRRLRFGLGRGSSRGARAKFPSVRPSESVALPAPSYPRAEFLSRLRQYPA